MVDLFLRTPVPVGQDLHRGSTRYHVIVSRSVWGKRKCLSLYKVLRAAVYLWGQGYMSDYCVRGSIKPSHTRTSLFVYLFVAC
jgi:hypothetical protein